jgi:hypothetical protein
MRRCVLCTTRVYRIALEYVSHGGSTNKNSKDADTDDYSYSNTYSDDDSDTTTLTPDDQSDMPPADAVTPTAKSNAAVAPAAVVAAAVPGSKAQSRFIDVRYSREDSDSEEYEDIDDDDDEFDPNAIDFAQFDNF